MSTTGNFTVCVVKIFFFFFFYREMKCVSSVMHIFHHKITDIFPQ